MGEWPIVPLGDLVDPERSICYGIVQPGPYVPDGIPILRVNNFSSGALDTKDVHRVSPDVEAKYTRSRLVGGELLVTLVGSIGQTAFATDAHNGWNVARAVGVVPLRRDVDSRWVNFAVRGHAAQDFMIARANTTVQTTFNLKDLARLPIPFPPDAERIPMTAILSALDDKIELNRRMNETLERQARALFRDWFVDFGPTRAKMAQSATESVTESGIGAKPQTALPAPYLSPALWSLFPDRLDDEGIPEGWEVFKLAQIAEQHTKTLTPAKMAESEVELFSLPAYDKGQIPAIDHGATIKSNKTLVPAEAVLLSKLNPEIQRVWMPETHSRLQQVSSTEFLAYTAKVGAGRSLLFCLFSDQGFREMLHGMVTGTSKSHQRISPPSLLGREVITGAQEIFGVFERLVAPFLKRVRENRAESRTLAQTRDLLLPRLMSGELRVAEAARAVEEVL